LLPLPSPLPNVTRRATVGNTRGTADARKDNQVNNTKTHDAKTFPVVPPLAFLPNICRCDTGRVIFNSVSASFMSRKVVSHRRILWCREKRPSQKRMLTSPLTLALCSICAKKKKEARKK